MIKYHRTKLGWSQFRLAKELNLTEKQGRYLIKDYETRGLHPPKELSIKLATIFNTGTKYFYDDYFVFLDNSKNIITNLRLQSNLSVEQISAKYSISKLTWIKWEQGASVSRKKYSQLKKELIT
jgi:transcriptional regulator with XRE-family HTH domain